MYAFRNSAERFFILEKIAVIGAGKAGSVLARHLYQKNYIISSVYNRHPDKAKWLVEKTGSRALENLEQAAEATWEADLVLLTVSDGAIASVSQAIAQKGGFRPGQVVLHTSGACPAAELQGVSEPLAFHPLQSLASREQELLPGTYFALEGSAKACQAGERLAAALQGKSFRIKAEDKALYHAGACVVSNYLVSLLRLAEKIYQQIGLEQSELWRAITPLFLGTWDNIKQKGCREALTGPVSRGDWQTVANHLRDLEQVGEPEKKLYQQLGLYTLNLAEEQIEPEAEQNLKKLFKGGD